MKKFLIGLVVVFLATVTIYAQDTLEQVLDTILNPPKITGMTLVEAFASASTYVAAIFVMVSISVAKWVPGLNLIFEKVKPYFRAITIGVAVIWVFISYGKLTDTQAGLSFILSNLFYEIIKALSNYFNKNNQSDNENVELAE